jgi:hypothetical protein
MNKSMKQKGVPMMQQIKSDDRVILSRLDSEDEEYYDAYLNKEGTVTSNPQGRFPCVFVQFDEFKEKEYLFVKNLDKI